MIVLRSQEVNGIKLSLSVDNSGGPFWLIASRGVKPHGEVSTRVYDARADAEQAFSALEFNFLLDELQQVIGDDEVFVRVLKLLKARHYQGVTGKSILAEARASVVN